MKRRDLLRYLEQHGCQLLREGGSHSVYVNRAAGKVSTGSRHRDNQRIPRSEKLQGPRSSAVLVQCLTPVAGDVGPGTQRTSGSALPHAPEPFRKATPSSTFAALPPDQSMPHAGDVLDLSPIGAVFHVRQTAEETQGRSFEMEWELFPRSGGTPVHVHPHATESYEVLAGELDLYVDGVWQRLVAGQAASVSPGVPHTFRNATDARVRVYNTHAPAMKYGEYFEGLHRVVSSGAVAPGRMSLKAVLYLSMLMTSFEDEIRSVKPPHALMTVLAFVARSLGYRVPSSNPSSRRG